MTTDFNDAVLREIDKIAATIPHDQIAIQFDVASAVFARLERAQKSYGTTKEEMQETFTQIVLRLANHVPADIDLLFHFCYGDAGHKHVVEPTDMGDMVEFANRLARGSRGRSSSFTCRFPATGRTIVLRAAESAEVAVEDGTVSWTRPLHRWGGRHGAASGYRKEDFAEFSIATECGFGRRDPATIPELLRIHAEVAGQS